MKRLIIEFEDEVELKQINQIVADIKIDDKHIKKIEIENKSYGVFGIAGIFDSGINDEETDELNNEDDKEEKPLSEHEQIKKELENNPNLIVHKYTDCKNRTGGRIIMGELGEEITCPVCLKRMGLKQKPQGKKLIIHKEDPNKKGYYLCIHATGKGIEKKITKDWKKVTCQNCLIRK